MVHLHDVVNSVDATVAGIRRQTGHTPTSSGMGSLIGSSSDEFYPEFRNAADEAIRACSYVPFWIGETPTNEGISDRVLAEIQRAEFVIADFTGQRQSVYFEAGFARGLGRPVIWCCQQDDVPGLHFDTRHLGHVAWKDARDLRVKLEASIRANIISRA